MNVSLIVDPFRAMQGRKAWLMGLVSVAVLSVGGLAWGSWAYFRTTVQGVMPIPVVLDIVNAEADAATRDIKANQEVAALLDVEVKGLEREIADERKKQAEAKAKMKQLRDALERLDDVFTFQDRTFSRHEVEQDLERRLDVYQKDGDSLVAKEEMLSVQRRALTSATDKIVASVEAYKDLKSRVQRLQSELRLAESAQRAGTFQFDDTALEKAKRDADAAEKRIRVLQTLVSKETWGAPEIPVEADTRPVTTRFDEFFDKQLAK